MGLQEIPHQMERFEILFYEVQLKLDRQIMAIINQICKVNTIQLDVNNL